MNIIIAEEQQNPESNTPLIYKQYFWILAAAPVFIIPFGGDSFSTTFIKFGMTAGIVLAIIGLDFLRMKLKKHFSDDKEKAKKDYDAYINTIKNTFTSPELLKPLFFALACALTLGLTTGLTMQFALKGGSAGYLYGAFASFVVFCLILACAAKNYQSIVGEKKDYENTRFFEHKHSKLLWISAFAFTSLTVLYALNYFNIAQFLGAHASKTVVSDWLHANPIFFQSFSYNFGYQNLDIPMVFLAMAVFIYYRQAAKTGIHESSSVKQKAAKTGKALLISFLFMGTLFGINSLVHLGVAAGVYSTRPINWATGSQGILPTNWWSRLMNFSGLENASQTMNSNWYSSHTSTTVITAAILCFVFWNMYKHYKAVKTENPKKNTWMFVICLGVLGCLSVLFSGFAAATVVGRYIGLAHTGDALLCGMIFGILTAVVGMKYILPGIEKVVEARPWNSFLGTCLFLGTAFGGYELHSGSSKGLPLTIVFGSLFTIWVLFTGYKAIKAHQSNDLNSQQSKNIIST